VERRISISLDEQLTWWSWKNLVGHADRLGMPHFQRDAVWEHGKRVVLLESLYDASPCGSFVLWEPKRQCNRPEDDGVALRRFAKDKEPMWLVDGQQRSQAMLDTFQQLIGLPAQHDDWSLVRSKDLCALREISALLPAKNSEEANETDDTDEDAPNLLLPTTLPPPASGPRAATR
jgi:hypothetical protein